MIRLKPDIICVGISCMDVIIRGVDFRQKIKGESRRADNVTVAVGGDAANQAIVLSKLGVSAKLITGLAHDPVGGLIVSTIGQYCRNLEDIVYTDAGSSPVNVIVVDKEAQRTFINTGDSLRAAVFKPDPQTLRGAKIVSLGSLFIPPFVDRDSIDRVVRAAKAQGSVVCADVIYNPNACALADLGDTLSCIDYIFPNDEEAEQMTGKSDLHAMADVFLHYGVKNVIIKNGKNGCFIKNAGQCLQVPAYRVNAVDTTGAGDCFLSGFMCALLEGREIGECCRFGSAVAAVGVQSMGANTGVQSRAQVERLMAEQQEEAGKHGD